MKGQSYLVTGAAGFIGHKTALMLAQQGHQVTALDNMNDYYDIKLKQRRVSELESNKNITFHQLDIENYYALEDLFKKKKFDKVLNLAARAGVRYSMENPHIYFSTNVSGSLNLLELIKKYNIPKYLLASTSSLYAGQKMPFNEELEVNEPISPYAASKKSAEVMAYTYHYLYGIDVSIVRYFTVYGPGSRPDMAQFRFMKWIDAGQKIQLYGDGTQARDFTYVDDIAAGTIAAAQKDLGFEVINLGGGMKPISINQMITSLEKFLRKNADIEYLASIKADMHETWADIDKASKVLAWSPQVSFEDGLERCIQDFQDNKNFYQAITL